MQLCPWDPKECEQHVHKLQCPTPSTNLKEDILKVLEIAIVTNKKQNQKLQNSLLTALSLSCQIGSQS